ncbi:CHAT domain-containing protein [Dapis sp. BLCC M229]|uniref:CHAT domain-containing protein n=1 Tax=Dapis sp. BLCC M229 TaxID=3400188 RepID=UPI003CF20F29
MNEQRLTAYAQLIEQLLECPQGKEPDILQNHQHLIDEGLIAVMQQYAQHLAEAGNENSARRLLNMAQQLTQWLNQSPKSISEESYITLLQQLLQAEFKIYDGEANKSIVYHILNNNRHLLNENLAHILPQYASYLIANNPPETTDTTVALIVNLSFHILDFPRGDRKAQIEIAIAGYLFTLSHHEENTKDWAKTQNSLGSAYRQRIKGKKAENIESAIACCQAALRVFTESNYPQDWAKTQNNLGSAYRQRIKGNTADNIESAIAYYQAALRVRTFSDYPEDWAMTQDCLGIAYYYSRIKGKKADNIETAIAYHQAALRVRTFSDYPEDWAETQNNLAGAYYTRIKGNTADNIESAIAYCQAALRVRTFSDYPEDWAETQNNLAGAYYTRIKGNTADNIESAIAYYQAALRVFTESNYPQDWAMIQHNLGSAYSYSSRIKGNAADNIESAIAYYQAALRVYTLCAYPQDWAMTQRNLGIAYFTRIKGNKADNIETAIAYYQAALRVYTESDYPRDWAMTQDCLGIAYSSRIKGNTADNIETAIAYYQAALRVRTESDYPRDWAETQDYLGSAYSSRIKGNKADNIETAIAYYQAALRVYTESDYPRDWAMTQKYLGSAYSSRIKGNAADNIETAIAYFQASLRVRTESNYPRDWAKTQNSLGLAYFRRIKGNAADNIETAIAYYQAALRVYTESDYPQNWAKTQNCLGTAYRQRIKGNKADNKESAINYCQFALRVYTESNYPQNWAETKNYLGTAYKNRIKGKAADNIETAIACYENALRVRTESNYPRDWAMTQYNLGLAYKKRIKGNAADNIETAIAYFQAALRVRKPDTLPANCLKTARQLANLALKQKNYQLAIDNYETAITAIEQSRDWIPDEIGRQEILRDNIYVYENMIQASVNAEQYDKALETLERFRCRRLLDLILTKDLYKNGEVPEDIRKLEAEMEEKQREIDNLRRQLQTPEDNQEKVGASRHITRDEWDDITEEIQKLMAEKGKIWQQMRQLDPVLAEGQQAPGVSVEKMKELLEFRNDPPQPPLERGEMEQREMERDDVALLSFYTTNDDTYIFILTQAGVKLHRCQEQGYKNLQLWLQDNWLEPYAEINDLAVRQAAAILAKCDIDAIESINPKPSNVIVKLKDGTTTEISFSDFNASRKQQKHDLYKQWQDKMEGMLKELADRLQINQLIEKLTDIKEIILVPFMYLHQIPLPALPLDNGEYLGDKFRVRIAPSTQVLTFCQKQPQNPEANLPRYGIVENTRDDLPYTPKECELVSQIYGVAPEHHLKGSKEATKAKYKQLLTREKVNGLLSSHHAKSNLTEPLESKLLLGDTDLTLGELLNASIRFPQLGDLFLSCCETALGNSELTDDIFTLSAAFLSAGASNVISSLWAVNDLATTILSYFYHRNRAQDIPSADALWQAQMELKELTVAKAEESLDDAEAVLEEFEGNNTVRASCSPVTEYEQKEKIADNCQEVLDLVSEAIKLIGGEKPFNHPYYWAGFVCQG